MPNRRELIGGLCLLLMVRLPLNRPHHNNVVERIKCRIKELVKRKADLKVYVYCTEDKIIVYCYKVKRLNSGLFTYYTVDISEVVPSKEDLEKVYNEVKRNIQQWISEVVCNLPQR